MNEREAKAEKITDNWIANNYHHKDLKELLASFTTQSKSKKEEDDSKEIQKDWHRLAHFMAGRK